MTDSTGSGSSLWSCCTTMVSMPASVPASATSPYRAHRCPGVRPTGGRAGGSGPQVAQDREDAAVLGARRAQAELGEDARDVLLGAAQRDHELLGDRLVGPAF